MSTKSARTRIARTRAGLMAFAGVLALGACTTGGGGAAPVTGPDQVAIVPDGTIREAILARWSVPGLDRRIDASVEKGRVLLTGRARTADERVEAVRLAWQADGVQEVINEIQLDDTSGISDTTTDTWITTQLRYKLVTDPEITSKNFTIDVVNGTVYLTGKARSQWELDRVMEHARGLNRVRRVVSHVRL